MVENQENVKPMFDTSNIPNLFSMNQKLKFAKETGKKLEPTKNEKGEVVKTDYQRYSELVKETKPTDKKYNYAEEVDRPLTREKKWEFN